MSNFKNYVNMFEFETELPGNGEKVIFKPVTTGQLKRLLLYETSQDSDSIENALDEMISECVVFPKDFNIKNLYLQDRFFLLVDIRKATRGTSYDFQTTCASCSSQSQQFIDITKLTVKKLNKKPVVIEPVKEKVEEKKQKSKSKIVEVSDEPQVETKVDPSKKVLDYSEWDIVKLNENISVRLSIVTRNMQSSAFDFFMKKHKADKEKITDNMKAVELSTLIQAMSIVSIITPEGEETGLPLEDRVFLLDNISQTELEKITKWYDDNDFGIDFSFDIKCPQCGFTEKKAVPVENFFY